MNSERLNENGPIDVVAGHGAGKFIPGPINPGAEPITVSDSIEAAASPLQAWLRERGYNEGYVVEVTTSGVTLRVPEMGIYPQPKPEVR